MLRIEDQLPRQNPNPVMRCAADGRLLFANDASRPVLEAWGVGLGQRLPPEVCEAIQRATDEGTHATFDICTDTRVFEIMVVGAAESTEVNAYGRDVTDVRRADDALREHQQRVQRILDTSLDAVVSMDGHGNIMDWSSAAERIFGWRAEEAAGQSLGSLLVPIQYREAHWAGLARYLETGHGPVLGQRIEITGLRKDGQEIPIELAITSISEGPTLDDVLFAGFLRDLSPRKEAEVEIERAREREVEVGASIQEIFLRGVVPQTHPYFEVAALSVPSRDLDGDFTDFLPHGTKCLDVIVGDVMGKGIPAALLGAATKSQFVRTMATVMGPTEVALPEPAEVTQAVHEEVTPRLIDLESFVTAVYARFDAGKATVTYVDAGHPKIIHLQADGSTMDLTGSSLPLGFVEDCVYRQDTVPMAPGDTFVLYTDGVTEVFSPDGEIFGEARLHDLLRQLSSLSPSEIVAELRREAAAHGRSTFFRDDLTLVVVRFRGEPDEAANGLPNRLVVRRDLGELAAIRSFVADTVRRLMPGATNAIIGRLQLALQEAVTNVLRHTTGPQSDPLEVLVETSGSGINVMLFYNSNADFSPEEILLPDVEGFPEGGFGLFIIEQSVEATEYGTHEDGRRWCRLLVEPRDSDRGS